MNGLKKNYLFVFYWRNKVMRTSKGQNLNFLVNLFYKQLFLLIWTAMVVFVWVWQHIPLIFKVNSMNSVRTRMRIRLSELPSLPALSESYRDLWPPFYSFMHLNAGLIYENGPSFKPVVKAKLPLNPQSVPPVHMRGMKVKNPSRTHWHTLFITSVVPHISHFHAV